MGLILSMFAHIYMDAKVPDFYPPPPPPLTTPPNLGHHPMCDQGYIMARQQFWPVSYNKPTCLSSSLSEGGGDFLFLGPLYFHCSKVAFLSFLCSVLNFIPTSFFLADCIFKILPMQRYSAQEQFIKATHTTQTTKSMPDVVILQKLGVSHVIGT